MRLTPQQLKEARDWIKDCTWRDVFDDEDVDEMSDAEIEAGIAKHWDGGLEDFIRCCNEDVEGDRPKAYDAVLGGNNAQPRSYDAVQGGRCIDVARLASLVRNKRFNRGLREVAKEIGIRPSAVSQVENGKTPDVETFLALCKWLNMSPLELIKNTKDEKALNSSETLALWIKLDRKLDPEIADALAHLVKVTKAKPAANKASPGQMSLPWEQCQVWSNTPR